MTLTNLADKRRFEETPFLDRLSVDTPYQQLCKTAAAYPDRPAVSFQLKSGPKDPAETLNWADLKHRVTQAANAFRALGLGPDDSIAYLLPNSNETFITLLAGMTACKVCPINALLEPEKIASILRDTGAKALVTLAPFPKTDLADRAADAVALAPDVETLIEVDLNHYLTPPLRWIVPLIRPRRNRSHTARVLSLSALMNAAPGDALQFEEGAEDRHCAMFHTGGTTGTPKIVQHRRSGVLYNCWCASELIFKQDDVIICPLPLFHVFAAYPIAMSCIMSGAHLVLPTPAGYRGDGVVQNFWQLIERYRVTFVITVPTAISALMRYPVNADVSTLGFAISGSAPLPKALFDQFEKATSLKILEGYGMTEATCMVACNPPDGVRKVGSVGLPLPYTDLKIFEFDEDGQVTQECPTGTVGEICIANPGITLGAVYTDPRRNEGLFANDQYLRTGDLGKLDEDGYVFITGRKKDLIIRGGHNIDPGAIEEAFMRHPQVAFAGAVGQPDGYAGEVPAVFLELVEGADVDGAFLLNFARQHIPERAAVPVYVEILTELPKTAVGKVFKPDLRKICVMRVFDDTLSQAHVQASVAEVIDDKERGLVARISAPAELSDADIAKPLSVFTIAWERA